MSRKPYAPRPYQTIITDRITDQKRCAIWAGMGLGKTVSTLTALDQLFIAGEDHPALILSPLRVAKSTWPNEARKWDHLRHVSVMPIVGNEDERRGALRIDSSVYSCNYDNLPWLIEHFGERWPFSTVIADEATRLKSFRLRQGGKRASSLARVAHTKIKRFVQLTGTPSPNGLADLWGQMWFIDAGQRLGRTFDSFRQRWFQKSFDGYGVESLPYSQEQIQDKLRDVCLSIDAKDWFDLKEPIISPVYVDLPPKVRKVYRDMEREMFMEWDGTGIEAFAAAARTQKLLQLANGAVYLNPEVDSDGHVLAKQWKEVHNEKLDALESIVEETNGAPLLVAYQFKSDLARIRKAFPKARLLDTNPATEDEWNAGKIPMLLAHPKSAGHGLNLQDGGNILVLFGHDWNLEDYMQIIERIGPVRQAQSGHDRPVFLYPIIARDTMDEDVMLRRETKRETQDILLDAMKRRM